jgi:hypothetical protein
VGILRDNGDRDSAFVKGSSDASLAFGDAQPPAPGTPAPGAPSPGAPAPGAPAPGTPGTPTSRPGASGEPDGEADAARPDAGRSELRRRRDALAEQVAELHWDLGGLAYEMAIRDHFRLDVLVRRAAILQERDAELAELERLLRMEEGGIAGSCPTCAAPHSRGALYCWQCGTQLMERRPSDSAAGEEADTAVIDALLAPADGERGGGERS